MKCPYCLSVVEAEAVVCKVCTKDLYLFKPMLEKLQAFETRLAEFPDRESAEHRISELEIQVENLKRQWAAEQDSNRHWGSQVVRYLCIPLLILLLGHAVIIVIYDFPLLYLRILSIAIPLPFAYALFSRSKRPIGFWLLGAIFLAISSVFGMSSLTSIVDGVSVLPRSTIEWKEFVEYSVSISFSFFTGMLLGSMSYLRQHRSERQQINPWLAAILTGFGDGKLSPDRLRMVMQNLDQFGSAAVALCTTAVSIYTGLKSIL